MGKIDLQQARGLLARAVLTQGAGFVYSPNGNASSCLNVPWAARLCLVPGFEVPVAGHPSLVTGCLIGTALRLAGVPLQELREKADSSVFGFENYLTEDARVYFGIAQGAQDAGASWGEAYKRAESHVTSDGARCFE